MNLRLRHHTAPRRGKYFHPIPHCVICLFALFTLTSWSTYANDIGAIRKLAEQGDAKSQFTLGACYAKGDGVGKDRMEAVKWFRLAAEVASLVRTIFNAPDMQTASQTLHTSLTSLRGMQQHDLADWLEENIHECLTILNFPPEIRRHVRTSNCMENLNRQCRRRTNVISVFPSVKALLRIVTARAADISDEWEGIHGRVIISPNTLKLLREQTTAASAPVPPPAA